MRYVKASQSWVLLYVIGTGRFMNGVLKWEGPVLWLFQAGKNWVLCCARCNASPCVFLRKSVLCFTGLLHSSEGIGPWRLSAEARGICSNNTVQRRKQDPPFEPWVFARKIRARRCWATSSWSRITPTWFRAWQWLSSSDWCLRYRLV